MTKRPYGFKINPRGETRGLPWQDAWREMPAHTHVGRLNNLRQGDVLKIAQRYDAMNSEIESAKVLNRSPQIPETLARQELLKADKKKLEDIKRKKSEIVADAIGFKDGLRPHQKKNTVDEADERREWRALLREQKEEGARLKLLESNSEARAAAFERPGALSGMKQETLERLYEKDLEAAFPEQVRAYRETIAAAESIDHAMRGIDEAMRFESVACGMTVEPGKQPRKPDDWE
jgi:hypothetical protein